MISSPSHGDFWDWNFISPQVGWLALDCSPTNIGLPESGLYKTIDGGQTWTEIHIQIQK